jgi:cell division protein FtsB
MMKRRATGGAGPAPSDRTDPKRGADGPESRAERWREIGPVVLVLTLAVAVLAGLAVLPARTWWTQRQNINEARFELDQAEAEVAELRAQRDLLATDAEVERLARQDFDLVFPGEESYRLLPPASTAPPATQP